MPQTFDQVKNPWGVQSADGGILEAQRSDLFSVDFSLPLAAIRAILQRATASVTTTQAQQLLNALPTNVSLPYFANGVEFPDARVAVSNVKRHEVPIPRPSLEEAISQFSITFTQDVGTTEDDPRSQVLAFLRAWRAVVRAGRDGQSQSELQLDLLMASADGRSLIPDYKHNFAIYLWRGRIPTGGELEFSDGVTSVNAGVERAGQWRIKKGWLVGFQSNPMRHAQSGLHEVRATFAAEAIVEGEPSGNVNVGQAVAVQ